MIKKLACIGCILNFTLSFNNFIFDFKSHYIPHPKKAYRGGQDAFFANQDLLMTADGVGGWEAQGIDPSGFSRQLAKKSGQSFTSNPIKYQHSPRELIQQAHDGNDNLGSATIVQVVLDFNNLKGCYLGDSGFMVIRQFPGARGIQTLIVYEYSQQQHSFNFPYQLAPKKLSTDNAKQAICVSVEIQPGDIIVVGSDGLFDNIPTFRIKQYVKQAIKDGTLLTTLSSKLAAEAIQYGLNPKYESPFAKRAKQQGILFNGGKLDDTTVIVAKIVDAFGLPKSTHYETNPQLLGKIDCEKKNEIKVLQQTTL